MIEFIIEILFFSLFGWFGHTIVKIMTFGKIRLEYGDSSGSVITEWIGFGIFLMITILIFFLMNIS
tara:strand:- start:134 stop:331 length:198 start_codon:yes stop_codon:yes gene_type:complete